jgi:hypothetical protein
MHTGFATGPSSFDIVPHRVEGNLWVYAYLHLNDDAWLKKSENGGATWSTLQADFAPGLSSPDQVTLVHCPYNNNSDGLTLYYGILSPGTASGHLLKSIDGGASHSTLVSDGIQIRRAGMETFTGNDQLLYWWRPQDEGLYKSSNGGTSWSAATMAGLSGRPTAAGGFPYNGQQYYLLTTGGIFVSIDGGASFINKTGDWAFGFTGSGSAQYFDIIVPDWTE